MVPHNAYLLVFVFRLGFHTSLLPTDPDRSRPIFCLYLALTYMDLSPIL